jgi:hypothetical protein
LGETTIRFHRSASKHGISQARVLHVVQHCLYPLYWPNPESDELDLLLFLGPDQHGVPLEVVAVELAGGDLLVIHAMQMRAKYADGYVREMRWREQ